MSVPENQSEHVCYYCGRPAKYVFKNRRHCCERFSSQCPAVREKARRKAEANIKKWKDNGESFLAHAQISERTKRRRLKNSPGLCEWCGNPHDGSYGTGRFCSNECKDAFIRNYNHTHKSAKVKEHLDRLRAEGKLRKKRNDWICDICGVKTETRKQLVMHRKSEHYNVAAESECAFCHKKFEKRLSMIAHLSHCPKHPLKEQHDESARRQGRTYSENYKSGKYKSTLGRHHQTRESIEKIMRTFEERQSRGDYAGIYRGIYYESSYELAWIVYNLDHGIPFRRCSESFDYYDSITGKWRLYFPDYELSDGTLIEIKGLYTQNTADKMQAVILDYHREIRLLEKQDLQKELEYTIKKYGKDFKYTLKDGSSKLKEIPCI